GASPRNGAAVAVTPGQPRRARSAASDRVFVGSSDRRHGRRRGTGRERAAGLVAITASEVFRGLPCFPRAGRSVVSAAGGGVHGKAARDRGSLPPGSAARH